MSNEALKLSDIKDNNDYLERYIRAYARGKLQKNLNKLKVFRDIMKTQPEIKQRVSDIVDSRKKIGDFINQERRAYFTLFIGKRLPKEEQEFYDKLYKNSPLFRAKIALLTQMNTYSERLKTETYTKKIMNENLFKSLFQGLPIIENSQLAIDDTSQENALIMDHLDQYLSDEEEEKFNDKFESDFFFRETVKKLSNKLH